ncbi:hypothetical protein I3843_09G136700 [Carya illinoinensis]|nr:hypothetical protein I3843_09G136700 [Carya illinoinensis]
MLCRNPWVQRLNFTFVIQKATHEHSFFIFSPCFLGLKLQCLTGFYCFAHGCNKTSLCHRGMFFLFFCYLLFFVFPQQDGCNGALHWYLKCNFIPCSLVPTSIACIVPVWIFVVCAS